MSLLITGARGLVGQKLVRDLESEHEVWALARTARSQPGRANWIQADLASPGFVSLLPPRIDTVVHLAQSVHYREFPDRADDIFAVNVASTARLLDWSARAGVRRFVLASAGGADRVGHASSSFYLASRRSAELLAESYRDRFAVVVLRFFFVYGPGQRRTMLIPRLIDSVKSGAAITLAGADGLRINPIHVADAAKAVARASTLARGLTLDVAGPEVLSLRAIADTIGQAVGRPPVFAMESPAAPDLIGDIEPMSRLLGAPVRTFASAVGDLV